MKQSTQSLCHNAKQPSEGLFVRLDFLIVDSESGELIVDWFQLFLSNTFQGLTVCFKQVLFVLKCIKSSERYLTDSRVCLMSHICARGTSEKFQVNLRRIC